MKKQWMVRVLSKTLNLTPFIRPFSSSTSLSSAKTSFAIKNVTKSNFESTLAELRRHVRDADFVAIDLEMTGVTSAPWRESFEFDRFDIRYLKLKDSAEKFAVVQFGVCPFRWDSSKNSFIAHPHNFYVFPRQEVPVDNQPSEFMWQTASIDFLAKYQFDFNMCIREGISYLSRGQEEAARRHLTSLYEDEFLESQFKLKESKDVPIVRMADVLFTERIKCKISEWQNGLLRVKNGEHECQKSSNDSVQQFETIFFKMRPAIKLNGFSSRQLRLIQLVTEKHFKDIAYIRVNGESSSLLPLLVYTDSKSDRDLLMKEVKACLHGEAEMKIKSAVGFRQVIDLLSSEQKLIVGHNCFLDIAHVYSKFLGPLPSTAEEYVSSIPKYFPYLIDTKILLNANSIFQEMKRKRITSLAKAFAFMCPEIASGVKTSGLAYQPYVEVEVQVDEMRSSNWNSGAKHEAGYDAFMTGCVFAQACSHIGIDFKSRTPSTNLALEEKLQEHLNLLYLSWINGDIIDLSTGKQTLESAGSKVNNRYPEILFSNIVLLWEFPSKLKAAEIRECITKVFGPSSVTSTYHLDKTAVFVQFSKAELVSDFLKLKATLETSNDLISDLHPLSKILEGGCTRAASYEVYKEICESSISKILFADQAEAVGIKWKTKLLEPNLKEMQEDETLGKEHGQHKSPNSFGKDEREKIISVIRDLSSDRFASIGHFDSIFPAEAQVGK